MRHLLLYINNFKTRIFVWNALSYLLPLLCCFGMNTQFFYFFIGLIFYKNNYIAIVYNNNLFTFVQYINIETNKENTQIYNLRNGISTCFERQQIDVHHSKIPSRLLPSCIDIIISTSVAVDLEIYSTREIFFS